MSGELPAPECVYGYPYGQLLDLFGPGWMHEYDQWMYGQTIAICEGQKCPIPHGIVYYYGDVAKFAKYGSRALVVD